MIYTDTTYARRMFDRRYVDALTVRYEYWRRLPGAPHPEKVEAVLRLWDSPEKGTIVFPAGHASRLARQFGDELVQIPTPPPTRLFTSVVLPFDPRPYQVEALEEMLRSKRGIVAHPTGSGKTYLAATLINYLQLGTLYLVPNIEILTQTAGKLKSWFGRNLVGQLGADKKEIDRPILVATAAGMWSLAKRGLWESIAKNRDLLIIDEAHHVNVKRKKQGGRWVTDFGNTWYRMALALKAQYRFGLTATPGDPSSLEYMFLEGATGEVIHSVSTQSLVESGILVRPKIFFFVYRHQRRYGDWREALKKGIYENAERNGLIAAIAKALDKSGYKTIVVVDRVETQGYALARLMPWAEFVHGSCSETERKRIRNAFEHGSLSTVISTVYGEGVDIHVANAIIVASGGKGGTHGIQAVQRLGRALRPAPGKSHAILVDIYDRGNRLLERHAEARKRIYEKAGHEVELKQWR